MRFERPARLRQRWRKNDGRLVLHEAWREGSISLGEFDATVQGGINHVSQADSRGLRQHVLAAIELAPGCELHYPGPPKARPPKVE